MSYRFLLGRLPAKIRDISRPRLKAWLNTSRVWKVETKGNHDRKATGMKMIIPIHASYIRATSRTDFHIIVFSNQGLNAIAILRRPQPVGMNASAIENTSPIVSGVFLTVTTMLAIIAVNSNAWNVRTVSWKLADILSLNEKILKIITSPNNTNHE